MKPLNCCAMTFALNYYSPLFLISLSLLLLPLLCIMQTTDAKTSEVAATIPDSMLLSLVLIEV